MNKSAKTRDNHYVPQWHQRGFLSTSSNALHYLDLSPDKKALPDGKIISMHEYHLWPTSKCFFQRDLYSTFFGTYINDEIEKKLFGNLDNKGSKAIWGFIKGGYPEYHTHFFNFFTYIDSQKIRTPKGLDWIKEHYPNLNQLQLMLEMQAVQNMHCTIWTEGVREIVSAEKSELKFILSDHPVTIYNYACPPESEYCRYPNDPSIALRGSQTIFPLDMNHCLILTNYEYAKNPNATDPLQERTNPRNFRNSLVRTDAFIRSRSLDAEEVRKINFIIKKRARRYIAASDKAALYPEHGTPLNWQQLRETLLPPDMGLFHFGGEMFVGYEDGTTHYQDAFGRTTPENPYLEKTNKKDPGPNDACTCGSGKKYKKCCRDKKPSQRPASNVLSIRERNLRFLRSVENILGISKGKTWDDVRKELSDEQVKNIHELVEFFWPRDTDIISLLPKSDGTLRALYTGIIDPRTISRFAASLTLYFDEILIQSPFANPAIIRPEFNPVQNPHQYKEQTLKNVMLLFILAPFIEAGFINFFPDPCIFDGHLQKQMLSMAEDRAKDYPFDETEREQLKDLHMNDFRRSILMLPKNQQKVQIRKALPHLSEDEIEGTLKYIDKLTQEDPFALLQDDVYGSEKGGQLMMMAMTPNFELALFIAQITGSFIFTDSRSRWKEMLNAQHKEGGIITYNWHELSAYLDSQDFPLNANPSVTFYLRFSGRLGKLRKAFHSMYSAIENEIEPARIAVSIQCLKEEFRNAHQQAIKEMRSLKSIVGEDVQDAEDYSFDGKLSFIIPVGGIVHNNVQRMLLSSGLGSYRRNVPMVVFSDYRATTEAPD